MSNNQLLDEQYAFRAAMIADLETDLVGPSAIDEILDEKPLDRYLMGVLYPVGDDRHQVAPALSEPDEPVSAEIAGVDAVYDPGVSLTLTKQPSSIGLSFSVDLLTAQSFTVKAVAARYTRAQSVEGATEASIALSRRRAAGAAGVEMWQRAEPVLDDLTIDATTPGIQSQDLADGLQLYCVVRSPVENRVPVTVVLRNTLRTARGESRDAFCWFQPQLTLTTGPHAFVERRNFRSAQLDDDDVASYELLFRGARAFAVGHGCAVHWKQTDKDRTGRLQTTFVPRYEVPASTPREAPAGSDLTMGFLSEAPLEEITKSLTALVREYRLWIEDKSEASAHLPARLRQAADRHLSEASTAADRMEAGLQLLEKEPVATAFRLMNRVMREQRRRQDWIRSGAEGPVPEGREQAWRPFQIAFILLNLESLVDPESPDRAKADLLWFPTGGGKTEAYLGLIAFTVFLRRLRESTDQGVAVLMRYTLRLLTLQQFERAAGLICAMEHTRRTTPALGDNPISLGLWVGQAATPNNLKEARRVLNKLARGEEVPEGNPMQLTKCPWCGTKLRVENYRIDRSIPSMIVECRNSSCAFQHGLPLYVVDEDVYRVRPSLLIGTVDKFAMMAWNDQVRAIFSSDGAGNPPDLIVQDELHLISGPLGTMVGLYETAIDAAAGRRHPAKVVASTATIRRARKQMRAVFDREASQFPPSGIEMSDSFFAQQADRDERANRCYVGLLAPGKSPATMLVRTYARLLQAASTQDGDDQVRDPYWTLVGYFNSLRVLGGAYMQVIDDVPDRIHLIATRAGQTERKIHDPLELTSRVPSSSIPDALDLLAHRLPAESAPSVVLATNMISVGVDVDRLGLMAVMGQPQATAEYIQATSRVGRKYPGLVVVMYNGARSRDRSHYENFLPYHQALYREVEATSATPFAARARDRGLHGVLVSMARLLVDEASRNDSAQRVEDFINPLAQIAAQIAARAGRVTDDWDCGDDTSRQLEELISVWLDEVAAKGAVKYDWNGHPEASLLVEAGKALTDDRVESGTDYIPWPTLKSLRDVDAESSLYLVPNREWRRS